MRLDFNKDNTVTVSDGGQELVWDVSIYDRTRLKDVSNVFRETNEFFEKLSASVQRYWKVFTNPTPWQRN